MLRKHMDVMSALGTMFRTRFGYALGAANAGWIDLSVDAPLLFQLKRDVEHLSAEEQCEMGAVRFEGRGPCGGFDLIG
jgi:hypothetical protein